MKKFHYVRKNAWINILFSAHSVTAFLRFIKKVRFNIWLRFVSFETVHREQFFYIENNILYWEQFLFRKKDYLHSSKKRERDINW